MKLIGGMGVDRVGTGWVQGWVGGRDDGGYTYMGENRNRV